MIIARRAGLGPSVLFALAFLWLALAGAAFAAAPNFPQLTGRVVDAANVLPPEVEVSLTNRLETLERNTGRQLVVATLPDLQGYEIEEYGYQLGRSWGIGQAGKNDGVLLIVAPAERKVRIEVGYGLEGVLTDALSSVILQTRVLPSFRAGDIPGGVVAGADALIEQLALDQPAAAARVAQAEAATRQAAKPRIDPVTIIIILFVIFFLLRNMMGGGRRRRSGLWIPPIIFGGGGWSDRGGGGFGGGGFGGGGGSFGGGGSSGSW